MIWVEELLYLRCREVPGTFLDRTGNMQRIDVIFWTTIFLWSCSNIGTYLLFGEKAIIPSDLVFVGFLLLVIIVSKISKKANRWLGTKI